MTQLLKAPAHATPNDMPPAAKEACWLCLNPSPLNRSCTNNNTHTQATHRAVHAVLGNTEVAAHCALQV